jgi:hypothetical protein
MGDRKSRSKASQNPHFGGSSGDLPLPARVVTETGPRDFSLISSARRVSRADGEQITCTQCQAPVDLDTIEGRVVEYDSGTDTRHICKPAKLAP